MKKQPSVRIIIPTYEPQARLIKDVLFNIWNQSYRNFNVHILINNSNSHILGHNYRAQTYFQYVSSTIKEVKTELKKDIGYTITHLGDIPQIGNYKGSIGAQAFNRGLDYALEHNYDYALLVAGDVCIPNNAIKEMLRPFKRFKDCGLSCLTCYIRYSGDGGMQAIMDKISNVAPELETTLDEKIPMVKPIDPPMDARKYYQKKYLKAYAGDGAMLIPKKIFRNIRMRTELKDGKYGADIAYCLDMLERFKLYTYINTRIYTPHLNIESDGKIVFY